MIGMEEKFCKHCQRTLPLSEFYVTKGQVRAQCKDCTRHAKRKAYQNSPKKMKDGIYVTPKGQTIIHKGNSTALYWNPDKIRQLKELYSNTANSKLAVLFNMSERTIIRKAESLGLKKNREWLSQISSTNVRLAILKNKLFRHPGMFKKKEPTKLNNVND